MPTAVQSRGRRRERTIAVRGHMQYYSTQHVKYCSYVGNVSTYDSVTSLLHETSCILLEKRHQILIAMPYIPQAPHQMYICDKLPVLVAS